MAGGCDSGWWQPIVVVDEVESFCERALPPEGNVKYRNYRLLGAGGVRAYTPTGDIHTTPSKGKTVSRYGDDTSLSPPRLHMLRLLEPGTIEGELLAQVLRPPTPRASHLLVSRAAARDTREFLQNSATTPSPTWSDASIEGYESKSDVALRCLADELDQGRGISPKRAHEHALKPVEESPPRSPAMSRWVQASSCGDAAASSEVAQLDERLSSMLMQSRDMQDEVAAIRNEMQGLEVRASAAATAARALAADAAAVRYLEHVLALLRGRTAPAAARAWPFAGGRKRDPALNYVV